MKKVIITFTAGTLCLLAITFVFSHSLYYPSLPLDTVSKKEAVEKIKGSNRQMVRLTNENGHEWYISSETNISVVDELIKEMVGQQGWVFTQKDGSGLFFERQGERLIVTTQMWTGDYVLIQIPAHFHN